MNRPSDGIVHIGEPLGVAILGIAVEDEVEVNIDGRLRTAVVERLEKRAA